MVCQAKPAGKARGIEAQFCTGEALARQSRRIAICPRGVASGSGGHLSLEHVVDEGGRGDGPAHTHTHTHTGS